jgi:hypothetical protein
MSLMCVYGMDGFIELATAGEVLEAIFKKSPGLFGTQPSVDSYVLKVFHAHSHTHTHTHTHTHNLSLLM